MPSEEVEGYGYASCRTCTWKISRSGDGDATEAVRAFGRDHAEQQGHEVDIITTERLSIDYRVERPS